MNHEKLSKRLNSVASFVKDNARLADIGSDHGYLPSFLVHTNKITYAVAGEVVEGPFTSAKKQVAQLGMSDCISVRLGDGLSVITPEDCIDTVTIAGMGGDLIVSILENGLMTGRLDTVTHLILQPNVDEEVVRYWLQKHNYAIEAEDILEENGRIYEIIVAKKTSAEVNYSPIERRFGVYLPHEKNKIFRQKWFNEYWQKEKVYTQLQQAQTQQVEKLARIQYDMTLIKEMIAPTVAQVCNPLEQLAPKSYAMEWDNVGLLIGDQTAPVLKIMITLDVTDDVVQEAIDNHIDLIITHHPILFKPIQTISDATKEQQMYRRLIQHNINVFAAHTNLDVAPGGMNDWLADQLQLKDISVLTVEHYDASNHPVGLGRIGKIETPKTFQAFLNDVKQLLDTKGLRYVGDLADKVETVAIIGGSAQSSYKEAVIADVFITGDTSYHVAQEIQRSGLKLIDPGHYIENIVKDRLLQLYQKWCKEYDWVVTISVSQVNTDPYQFEF